MTVLDGAMGSLLQAQGLKPGESPETWNVLKPDAVRAVHAAYVAAGSDVVYANTFGANRLKYHDAAVPLAAAVAAGVRLAREAGARRVALDVGPTGRLLKPAGDLDFEEAYEAFAEQVRLGAAAGADLVVVETMGDVRELKAAVLAAKENCSLPVYATVALGEDGKLLTGGDVECVAALLEGLRVDALGFNCGLGPDRMLPFVKRLAAVTRLPIIVKPNAGLPQLVDGRTKFLVGPGDFAACVMDLVRAGASIVGGCCGTTPEHVAAVARALAAPDAPVPPLRAPRARTVVSSGTHAVELRRGEGLIVGERLNPTGKKKLKAALTAGDVAYVLREAVAQADAGAAILDVNVGVPGLDEAPVLAATVEAVQSVVDLPLALDTSDPAALARALRRVNGKPLVNSVNGKRESMDAVFPLVAKHGGVIVALTLDEAGIPDTSEGRLAIARRILQEGAKYGFGPADFVFDALTLAVSAQPDAARTTLETVRRLTDELGVATVLGVSNVSFGLPNRPALNAAMLAEARKAGLAAAIFNPSAPRDGGDDPAALAVLAGADDHCAAWVARETARAEAETARGSAAASEKAPADDAALEVAVRRGLKADAARAAESALAAGTPPLELIDSSIVPALGAVGDAFEVGRAYLPQLLMAADAASAAFAVVRRALAARPDSRERAGSPIVLATVKGDVHDIGKNIVRALLENYGFAVVDLGRDVAPEAVVEAARKNGAALVGLSALMTTTVGAMAETIALLKRELPACRTVVGGAVLTADFAAQIGADFYSKDAMATVRVAQRLLMG